MKKIGIYGGTFNPPHTGHLQAAKQAVEVLDLDQLLMIPDRIAPHKDIPAGSPTPEQRLEMLRIALTGEEKILPSDIELRREGVSYTYLTLEALREIYPGDELILLMGTDMFLSFDSWKEPEKICSLATLGVFYRGEKGEKEKILAQKEALEAKGAKIQLVENEIINISSTQLRRLLAFHAADEFLPAGVGEYIRANGLYDTAAQWQNLPMEELEPIVIRLLHPNRVAHVLGCRDEAVRMAAHWGEDVTNAARAGILHDITKVLDGPLQLTLCAAYDKVDRKSVV